VQQALWSGVGALSLFLLFSTTNYQPATPRARGRKSRVCDNRQAEGTAKILAVPSLFSAVWSILKSLEGDMLPKSAATGVQDR